MTTNAARVRRRAEGVVHDSAAEHRFRVGSSVASSFTFAHGGPNMPRRPTPKPVALASTVVSIESFVASANDVTFRAS